MLYYITYTHLPTTKAFGYAIAKMCASFAVNQPVTLIIPRSAEREVTEDLFTFYDVPQNFKVRELPCLDLFRFKFLGSHIPFVIRKFTFAISVFFNLTISREDTCYSRDIWSLVLARLKTRRVYLEIHYLSRLDALCVKMVHFARKIVVITSFLRRELIALGYAENNILVAPSGFDRADFDAITDSKAVLRNRLELPADKKIVLYSGNLFAWKGVFTLVDAFKDMPDDICLVVIGGSEDTLPQFKEYVSSKEYRGRVLILGHKKHAEVASYLKAADLLVIPNSGTEKISKYNTSPIKLFEYMASGVPIVASDLPSIREILSEKNASFAEPDDAKSLAQVIRTVCDHPAEAQVKAQQAEADSRNYGWDNRARRIEAFMHNC
jgi:glycosyltransferase involved in cell wall biosynthesis